MSEAEAEPQPKKVRANASSVHEEFTRVYIVNSGKQVLSSKCKHCDADPLSGVNPSNLKRHLKSAHIAVHDKVQGMFFLILIKLSNYEICFQPLMRHEHRRGEPQSPCLDSPWLTSSTLPPARRLPVAVVTTRHQGLRAAAPVARR